MRLRDGEQLPTRQRAMPHDRRNHQRGKQDDEESSNDPVRHSQRLVTNRPRSYGQSMTLMLGIGVPELLVLVVLFVLVVGFGGYWLIRLAVRHGSADAQRKTDGGAPGTQA